MLSRIAESLFWPGRYVERADDTARILDVFMHRLLDDPATDEHAACRTLYAILGVEPADASGARYDAVGVMELLGFDSANAERDRRGLVRGPGQRARHQRGDLERGVGVPERHLARAAGPDARPPDASGPTCTCASSGSGRRCSSAWPTRR